MQDLRPYIVAVPDFPKPGIVFRDISPLLRHRLHATTDALSDLLSAKEWEQIEACVGVESRGFVLAATLAARHEKGVIMARKKGKLPPPTVQEPYSLEYGSDVLEIAPGSGKVVLVDDVLATGGTLRAAANLCVAAGYEVVHMIVLIDLGLCGVFSWRGQRAHAAIRY